MGKIKTYVAYQHAKMRLRKRLRQSVESGASKPGKDILQLAKAIERYEQEHLREQARRDSAEAWPLPPPAGEGEGEEPFGVLP